MAINQSTAPCIAIITVTLNASNQIGRLAQSLAAQTDKNFIWIVKDCCSDDSTIEIIDGFRHLFPIHTIISLDSGIYDGLNQAIESCTSLFYLTAGADDFLFPSAVESLNNSLINDKHSADIYLNCVKVGNKVIKPGRGNGLLYGMQGFAANHSLGCLIRQDLHQNLGLYSTKLQVAADSQFLYKLFHSGCKFSETGVVVGEFSLGGVSTSKMLFVSHSEFASVQICYHRRTRFLQILFFMMRLIKNWRKY